MRKLTFIFYLALF